MIVARKSGETRTGIYIVVKKSKIINAFVRVLWKEERKVTERYHKLAISSR